jgi:hypothetical protein
MSSSLLPSPPFHIATLPFPQPYGTPQAVRKRQDNKLENCCIWLVICLNLNKDWLLYVTFVDLQSVSMFYFTKYY